jgi:hypothetical protein
MHVVNCHRDDELLQLEADIEQQEHQYLQAGVVSSAVGDDDEDSEAVAAVGGRELGNAPVEADGAGCRESSAPLYQFTPWASCC